MFHGQDSSQPSESVQQLVSAFVGLRQINHITAAIATNHRVMMVKSFVILPPSPRYRSLHSQIFLLNNNVALFPVDTRLEMVCRCGIFCLILIHFFRPPRHCRWEECVIAVMSPPLPSQHRLYQPLQRYGRTCICSTYILHGKEPCHTCIYTQISFAP